jgi:hypothetical protein
VSKCLCGAERKKEKKIKKKTAKKSRRKRKICVNFEEISRESTVKVNGRQAGEEKGEGCRGGGQGGSRRCIRQQQK